MIEHLGFEEPTPRSRKYKTYKSIFVKNIKKTCEKCRKNIGKENKDLFEIYKKLSILSYYSFNRYEFYEKQLYSEFCRFTKDELEKLYKQSEHDNFILCEECNNEDLVIEAIEKFKIIFLKEKQNKEEIQKFNILFYKDFFRVIIRNLNNIINYKKTFYNLIPHLGIASLMHKRINNLYY